MKKVLSLILMLALMLPFCASAEREVYALGDTMEDFTATLADGTEVSLSGLLAEKKMVLINFWASWCGPCRSEFPYMEAAYIAHKDDVAVVALSIENGDTNEKILAFKEANGLTELPMGRDEGRALSRRFKFDGIPTSVVVDRFGRISLIEIGSTDAFEAIFDFFTADDYTESQPQTGIPAPRYGGEMPSGAALSAALNAEGGALVFHGEENCWPFLPAADGGAVSSNAGVDRTTSAVSTEVNCDADAILRFEARVSSETGYDGLIVYVDGAVADSWSGVMDWTAIEVPLFDAGTKKITFVYLKDSLQSLGEDMAAIRNVEIVSGAQDEAVNAAVPHVLPGQEIEIVVTDETAREIVVLSDDQEILDFYADTPVYIANNDSVTLKVKIGADIDVRQCALADAYDCLAEAADAEYDEEGLFFFSPLLAVADDGLGYNCVTFYGAAYDRLREDGPKASIQLFTCEEDANYFLAHVFNDRSVSWMYADGALPATNAMAQPPALEETEIPAGHALYTIIILDEQLTPVDGALVQVCDESTCEVLVSEDGIVEFVRPCYPYEIHILSVPEPYAPVTETYTLPAEGNEDDILLILLSAQ